MRPACPYVSSGRVGAARRVGTDQASEIVSLSAAKLGHWDGEHEIALQRRTTCLGADAAFVASLVQEHVLRFPQRAALICTS
eukprot:450429-Pleurochrysis_carterae.AAC.2